jgi:hypothetical protein
LAVALPVEFEAVTEQATAWPRSLRVRLRLDPRPAVPAFPDTSHLYAYDVGLPDQEPGEQRSRPPLRVTRGRVELWGFVAEAATVTSSLAQATSSVTSTL